MKSFAFLQSARWAFLTWLALVAIVGNSPQTRADTIVLDQKTLTLSFSIIAYPVALSAGLVVSSQR